MHINFQLGFLMAVELLKWFPMVERWSIHTQVNILVFQARIN